MILLIIVLLIIILAVYFFKKSTNGYSRPSKPQNKSFEEEPYYIYADADRINEVILHDDFDDFEN